jgi:transcriptional regulator with XRE-family HTH domain
MTTTDDPARKDVGLRLKAARELAGMTQQFVADAFGVGKGTVSAWETGGGDPGIYRLRRLAKLYDVTTDSLLWSNTPSRDAQKLAVAYDSLSDEQRRKFDAFWMAHFERAPDDEEVAASFRKQSGGRYKLPDPIADSPAPAPAQTKRRAAK